MKILIVKNETPGYLSKDQCILGAVKEGLLREGFVPSPFGYLERGPVVVAMAAGFRTAHELIEKMRPRLFIADWRLDRTHRHAPPPENEGGAALARIALRYGCEEVLCLRKNIPGFLQDMRERTLDVMGGRTNGHIRSACEPMVKTLPDDVLLDSIEKGSDPAKTAAHVTRHILEMAEKPMRPFYGPPVPATVPMRVLEKA